MCDQESGNCTGKETKYINKIIFTELHILQCMLYTEILRITYHDLNSDIIVYFIFCQNVSLDGTPLNASKSALKTASRSVTWNIPTAMVREYLLFV